MHLAATWLVNSTYFLNGNRSIQLLHVPVYGHLVAFVNDHLDGRDSQVPPQASSKMACIPDIVWSRCEGVNL
jgi:hypothetical protein